ncbi:hypothetical protein V3C99_011288 [Haemonchus contortus]
MAIEPNQPNGSIEQPSKGETGETVAEGKPKSPSQPRIEPFHRALKDPINLGQLREQLQRILAKLNMKVEDGDGLSIIGSALGPLIASWRKRDAHSERYLRGLLFILEYCLANSMEDHQSFELLVTSLGYNTVQFWRAAVPNIFDSDLAYGTKFRDSLLFALTLYDVNTGKNRLRELYAAVPGIRKSLLGVNAKQFGEKFHHLQKKISRHSSMGSMESIDSDGKDDEQNYRTRSRGSSAPHSDEEDDDEPRVPTGGIANTHFQQRVINVSNAPPVSLKREKTGDWEIKQGSGGLVACVDPVMNKDRENIWLANLGMNLKDKRKKSMSSEDSECSAMAPSTNTLGLPLIKQAIAEVLFHVLADDDKPEKESNAEQRKAREEMSLLGVLNNYNRGNYKLNPVIVQEEDYNVYYGGISNGLLWPALHNLPEYIVSDYDTPKILRDHWCAYVRVNYQFAIDAVRNSRPQDFIWIHDYHLMLTGMIMQSLDPNLDVGFFLHTPFQPPDSFFTKYVTCGLPVLRGLLRFTKVGFQTHRDRAKYLELVQQHLKGVVLTHDHNMDIYTVTHEGWTCSLGVFPVSIKNDDFLKFVHMPESVVKKEAIRKKILGTNPPKGSRFFFSVERFDYTKGIKEKLVAYKRYFEKYPDRIGKDVLYQVAVTNRRSVDTYRVYQDECIDLAKQIVEKFKDPNRAEWKPLVFQTDGLPRPELVAAYMAMDIGIVTPKKDGMNLVAKEMLVCNPQAGLILSTGAGSEIQFTTSGLYKEDGEKNYHRVSNLYDVEAYADTFYAAATEPVEVRAAHGKRLSEFILSNDIERWSAAFLDPSWTHQVIRPTQVNTLEDFFSLMMRTRNVRRQIVDRVLKGIPIRQHFMISIRNAKDSLENSCGADSHTLVLRPSPDSSDTAKFDIKNELEEFEKDLSFMDYAQSEDVDNVEQFVDTLKSSHPVSEEKFKEEVEKAVDLLYDADHLHYFFTDRDGTLKSYACSYPSSIQPAYSGVIQAQFARRCAQTCCILTTAPMMHVGVLDVSTIPPGYYYYGASAGREWFIDPTNKFKDTSIPEKHLQLLDQVFQLIQQLLERQEFRMFTWVGSGLQKHYGHVTIAHQDIYGSVNNQVSEELFEEIHHIVSMLDPDSTVLEVKTSKLDIKIVLKGKGTEEPFNKGDGIRMLCEKMKCDLKEGNILVCGDSATDLPMLEECLTRNPSGVYTIWVTTDEPLQQKVRDLCGSHNNTNIAFVSCPEVLLGAMAQATIREISIVRRD